MWVIQLLDPGSWVPRRSVLQTRHRGHIHIRYPAWASQAGAGVDVGAGGPGQPGCSSGAKAKASGGLPAPAHPACCLCAVPLCRCAAVPLCLVAGGLYLYLHLQSTAYLGTYTYI
jgi:hypothetical protein